MKYHVFGMVAVLMTLAFSVTVISLPLVLKKRASHPRESPAYQKMAKNYARDQARNAKSPPSKPGKSKSKSLS